MNKSELQIIADLVAEITTAKLQVTPHLNVNNFTKELLGDLLDVVNRSHPRSIKYPDMAFIEDISND